MCVLCRSCKQPFVAVHYIATRLGSAKTRSRICPDCAANMGRKPDTEMDCVEYSRRVRLSARLRDGYSILRGAA